MLENTKLRRWFSMKKQRFTLIELLTVIAIIAVLMGLLLPAIGKIKEAGKKAKAKAQMKTLELAIKNYEATYGVLPNLFGETDDTYPLGDPTDNNYTSHISGYTGTAYSSIEAYDILMQVLAKVDLANPPATAQSANKSGMGNDRNIPFIDAPAKFITDGYRDPFATTANPTGSRYIIKIDFNYDNVITVGSGASAITVHGSTAIYSCGVNGNDNKGLSNGGASGINRNDDITSWEQ